MSFGCSYPAKPEILLLEKRKLFHFCLHFEVWGTPRISLTFYKNKQFFISDQNSTKDTDFLELAVFNPGDGTQRNALQGCLYFKTPSYRDNANYTLVATNFLGSDETTLEVIFIPPPGTPRKLMVTLPPFREPSLLKGQSDLGCARWAIRIPLIVTLSTQIV